MPTIAHQLLYYIMVTTSTTLDKQRPYKHLWTTSGSFNKYHPGDPKIKLLAEGKLTV
jgi:hypothetical protein